MGGPGRFCGRILLAATRQDFSASSHVKHVPINEVVGVACRVWLLCSTEEVSGCSIFGLAQLRKALYLFWHFSPHKSLFSLNFQNAHE